MACRNRYYCLVASLPALVSFEGLSRLPISPERLRERLRLLEPADAAAVKDLAEFFSWQRSAEGKTDADVAAGYNRLRKRVRNPWLRDCLDFAAAQRTILAALRRRRDGRQPRRGEIWGVGDLAGEIERRWASPEFALAARFPWVREAAALLGEEEALELERLLIGVNWRWVTERSRFVYFGFAAVLAYLVKWDLTRRWLVCDRAAARARFEELVKEMLDEYQDAFDRIG